MWILGRKQCPMGLRVWKRHAQHRCGSGGGSRYEQYHLRQPVHNYKDHIVRGLECGSRGLWKLSDAVHGNGFPWTVRNRELLEQSIRLMSCGLIPRTRITCPTVFRYEVPKS